MNEARVVFPFTARYYQIGEITGTTRAVWFVLHGYGQLARFFIRKFETLLNHNIVVVAPEGLSRFYLSEVVAGAGRKNDRVGATWMTKEDRLTDISNYLVYLNSVYEQVMKNRSIPVTLLGFSQGSATASRWALTDNIRYEQLILWAGIFPPDMDFARGHDVLSKKRVVAVYGNNDPFLTDERFAEMNALSAKLGVHVERIRFDGAHDIDASALASVI